MTDTLTFTVVRSLVKGPGTVEGCSCPDCQGEWQTRLRGTDGRLYGARGLNDLVPSTREYAEYEITVRRLT